MKHYFYYLLVFLLTFSLFSCTKEMLEKESNLKNTNDIQETILNFKNETEFQTTLETIISFSKIEREQWAKENNFCSYAEIAENFYFMVNPEQFTNENEVRTFVNEHQDYLQLNTRNGELYLETPLIDNLEKYLVNKDRLYQIGDQVYKVFDGLKIHTNIQNIAEIKKIKTLQDVAQIQSNNGIIVEQDVILNTKVLPGLGAGFTNYDEQDVDVDKGGVHRMHVRFCICSKIEGGYERSSCIEFVIRPYQKVLGIWYWKERFITSTVMFAENYNGGILKNYRSICNKTERVHEGRFTNYSSQLVLNPIVRFYAYDVSATHDKMGGLKNELRRNPENFINVRWTVDNVY